MQIRVMENGPYLVSGSVPLAMQTIETDANGDSVGWVEGRRFEAQEKYALCRCGQSSNKPFCDGTHKVAGFEGTETGRRLYAEMAVETVGPELTVTDAKVLCAAAAYCHPAAGRIWDLALEEDAAAVALAEREAALCPSGRLVAWRARQAVEPELDPSIGVVEDPHKGVSGPLWVRGGIRIESFDGHVYEVRNRVTLCRCGQSKNKPFCDTRHIPAGFNDGLFTVEPPAA